MDDSKRVWLVVGWGLLVVMGLWACGLLPQSPSGQDTSIPTPVVQGSGGALPTPVVSNNTASPTPLLQPSPTPTLAGTKLSCGPFQIIVPAALGIPFQCFQADFGYFDGGATITIDRWGVSPTDIFCEHGCIDLIPVARAKQVLGNLYFPPQGQNAAVTFEAVQKALTFQGGKPAERSLEIHGQSLVVANNQDLRYIVRGMTEDGQYALFVTLPIDAPILPTHPDPAMNTNPQALQPLPSSVSDIQGIEAYNQKAAQELNRLAPSAFTPNLALLDQMIESLIYAPTP